MHDPPPARMLPPTPRRPAPQVLVGVATSGAILSTVRCVEAPHASAIVHHKTQNDTRCYITTEVL